MSIAVAQPRLPKTEVFNLQAYRFGAALFRLRLRAARLIEQTYPPLSLGAATSQAPGGGEASPVTQFPPAFTQIQTELASAVPLLGYLQALPAAANPGELERVHRQLLAQIDRLSRLPHELQDFPSNIPELQNSENYLDWYAGLFEQDPGETAAEFQARIPAIIAAQAEQLVGERIQGIAQRYHLLLQIAGLPPQQTWSHLGEMLERERASHEANERNESAPAWHPELLRPRPTERRQLLLQLQQLGFRDLPDAAHLNLSGWREAMLELHHRLLALPRTQAGAETARPDEFVAGRFGLQLNVTRRELQRVDWPDGPVGIPINDLEIVRFIVQRGRILAADALEFEPGYRLDRDSQAPARGSTSAFSQTMKGVLSRVDKRYFQPLGLRLRSERGARQLVERSES